MAIKMLVVDDHPVVRIGLKQMTAGTDIHVVAEAESAAEAVGYIKKMQFDVVLLDVRMPDTDGLRCLADIRKLNPNLPVLMYSAYDSPTYVARAVALGASGYLSKSARRDALTSAIVEVAGGGTAWSREDLRRVSAPPSDADPELALDVPLTRRELEVLKQLAFGLTNKEIAETLGISYETVKEHVQHVLQKLGVSDRTQAAVWAVRQGIA